MPRSTLDPDTLPTRRTRQGGTGHDTKALGPSDSSDSGSDMAGPGLIEDDQDFLDRGTNDDLEPGPRNSADAGASIGDDGMDSNSDRYGTGEARTAGKEPRARSYADVDADRIVGADEAGLGEGLDQAEEARLGITDEELEAEAGAERAPFDPEGDAELLREPPAPKPRVQVVTKRKRGRVR